MDKTHRISAFLPALLILFVCVPIAAGLARLLQIAGWDFFRGVPSAEVRALIFGMGWFVCAGFAEGRILRSSYFQTKT